MGSHRKFFGGPRSHSRPLRFLSFWTHWVSEFKKRGILSDENDFEALQKISVASHDMKFVFASLLMIISTSQSKRDGRTTLRWDSMDGNVSRWCFFKFIITTTSNPYQPTQKREFSQVTRMTSGPSKKFSVASHDMKFVFASFLTIISISQSKRGGRTTRRSDFMVGNASKWRFLKFHAHWT